VVVLRRLAQDLPWRRWADRRHARRRRFDGARRRPAASVPARQPVVGHHEPMTKWLRDYWADDDVWFYFEVDDAGYVQRQVALEGPDREANAACSLQECEDAYRAGTIDRYYETYGLPDEWCTWSPAWDHAGFEHSTKAEFDGAWSYARRACEAGSRARPER
jgi:hypothetical protein